MAEEEIEGTEEPKKKGLLVPLILGLILAVVAGGGSFWALTSGPLAPEPVAHAEGEESEPGHMEPIELEEVAFVALDQLIINMGTETNPRHLIFTAQLEVAPDDQSEVEHLKPRVMDVLNSYLRVVEFSELSDPRTLARLRAQLLRRIQIVTGDSRVRDLLVTEFVVN